MEGRARRSEFRPGDAHGIEGVDVEDVEAAASVYQHLGEVLLMDDGVDDEWVASQSSDVGWMVPLIKSDRRFRPAKEGGDDRFGDARFLVAHFMLGLGVDGIRSPKDHDAFLKVGEAVPILAHRASFLGRLFLALPFLWLAGLSQKVLQELIVLIEVLKGVGMVGACTLHELIEVV